MSERVTILVRLRRRAWRWSWECEQCGATERHFRWGLAWRTAETHAKLDHGHQVALWR